MSCLSEGILQARLDGELGEDELRGADAHLATCATCRERAQALAAQAAEVRRAMGALASAPDEAADDAGFALARFRAEHGGALPGSSGWLGALFAPRWRPAWAGLGVAALVVACFSFAPARSWAQRILAMLRVQKIAVVPIDLHALPGPESAGAQGRMVSQLLSDSVVVTMSPGEPQLAADAARASQLAGFPVRMLGSATSAPQIKVQGEQAFQMTLNRDRLQAVLDGLGRSDLQLPASVDGAIVAVHIPKVVMAVYGNCPNRSTRNSETPPQPGEFANCLVLAQVPSPTVSVPPDLNIQQLAELGLQAAGMSAQDAQAFCQTVDWTSTLVLPIPRDGGAYETVSVDGVQGTLITFQRMIRSARGPASISGYALLWVKNGFIYSLTGFGSPDQAVSLANSLE